MYNLLDSCTFYPIDLEEIPNLELKDTIIREFGIDDAENGYANIDGVELDIYTQRFGDDAFGTSVNLALAEFDEDYLVDELTNMIGIWPHYLVLSNYLTNLYKITSDISKTVLRNSAVDIFVEEQKEGRGIKCRELKQNGNIAYIIGITQEEMEEIENHMDFGNMFVFAESIFD